MATLFAIFAMIPISQVKDIFINQTQDLLLLVQICLMHHKQSCKDLLLLVQICLKQHPSDVVFFADLQLLQNHMLTVFLLKLQSHSMKPQWPMQINQRNLLPLITRGVRSAKRRGMAALVANPLQHRASKDISGWMARWSGKSPETWQSSGKFKTRVKRELPNSELCLRLHF